MLNVSFSFQSIGELSEEKKSITSYPVLSEIFVRILREFSFEQARTHVSALLDAATAVFMEAGNRSAAMAGGGSLDTAQLLVIVSDGRGLFYEGADKVDAAVRQARDANIFVVFVVVDNPENKVSEEFK
jgi:midasin